jgi:hypothetical protein
MKDAAGFLGVGLIWLAATALDLLILTAVIYAIGHWVLGVW